LTRVIRLKDGIEVRGHANYGKHGEDIVCSAVSTLVQTLVVAVEELTADKITYDMQPGKVDIKFWCLSDQSKVLIDAFFLGVKGVAEAYPDNVKVIEMTEPFMSLNCREQSKH
jgi:uncharacterized protein YsxB (DUF464 family)